MSTSSWLPRLKQSLYDRFVCTPASLRGPSFQRAVPGRGITVAIPHYNRGALIHQALHLVLRDERVSEIVIVDDGSSAAQYDLLRRNVEKYNTSGKIKLHRREENRGAMWTKIECVEKSSYPWVILLDSDNTLFGRYLDAVFALPVWAPDTIYCPSLAFPNFSFQEIAGRTLDFDAICDLSRSGILRRVYIINDGNYFLHRDTYVEVIGKLRSHRTDASDVMTANYLWLSEGKKLHVMADAHYCHRLSPGSFWARTADSARESVLVMFARMDQGKRFDQEFMIGLPPAPVSRAL